jgi:hypothetical protein
MVRRQTPRLLVAAVLAALAAGCLDFDEQTVYIEHDEASDRLILVIHYKGLYAAPDERGDVTPEKLQEARDQLATAIDTKQMAFRGNWPYTWSVPELTRNVRDEWDLPAPLRQEFLWLLAQIRTLDGGFYLDERGRLCGMQVVIVENLSQVLARTNAAVGLLALVAQVRDETGERVLQRFFGGEAKVPSLSVKGHSVSLAYPISEEEMMDLRREFADGAAGGDDADARRLQQTLDQLVGGPIWAWHEDGVLRVKVGLQSQPSTLVLRPEQGRYANNLVDHVREAYGFRLFANVVRYILEPEAGAETEGEEAAKLIAPRLIREERVRFVLQQIDAQPSPECYAALHREILRLGFDRPEQEMTDAEVVEFWRERLAGGRGAGGG